MAIVSISRIQVRRGQKNTGSGVPQLAGGEFGWAVDAQELYIGNGSVSEGSPSVGNTKVLTEHDNLFELSNQYIYKNGSIIITGVTQDAPIQRTLQERLDDIVNVRSFGAQGVGGSTDDTVELQRAIDQLFTGDGTTDIFTEQRVTLYIPAGTYKISSSLKLPPYSTLIGDGSEHTVIEQTANFPVLETVNGSRTTTSAGNQTNTSNNLQAKHILIKGLTLKSFNDNSALKVNSCSHSTFEDIKLVGNYDYVTPANTPYTNNYGIHLTTVNPIDSTVITCEDNLFKNIKIANDEGVQEGFETAVYSNTLNNVTNNRFENCSISYCNFGVRFDGPYNNSISNNEFKNIRTHAIHVVNGVGNSSINNNYTLVGNNAGPDSTPIHSVIQYDDEQNISIGDSFSRTKILAPNTLAFTPYITEIAGKIVYEQNFDLTINNLPYDPNFRTILRLPAESIKHYTVNYIYRSGAQNVLRHGVLELLCKPAAAAVSMTDTYEFVGDINFEPAVNFQALITTLGGYTTLLIQIKDEIINDNGTVQFQIRTQS